MCGLLQIYELLLRELTLTVFAIHGQLVREHLQIRHAGALAHLLLEIVNPNLQSTFLLGLEFGIGVREEARDMVWSRPGVMACCDACPPSLWLLFPLTVFRRRYVWYHRKHRLFGCGRVGHGCRHAIVELVDLMSGDGYTLLSWTEQKSEYDGGLKFRVRLQCAQRTR